MPKKAKIFIIQQYLPKILSRREQGTPNTCEYLFAADTRAHSGILNRIFSNIPSAGVSASFADLALWFFVCERNTVPVAAGNQTVHSSASAHPFPTQRRHLVWCVVWPSPKNNKKK